VMSIASVLRTQRAARISCPWSATTVTSPSPPSGTSGPPLHPPSPRASRAPSPGAVTSVMTPRLWRKRRMRLLARSTMASTSFWVSPGAGWRMGAPPSRPGAHSPSSWRT
jgi:hypothetical protein